MVCKKYYIFLFLVLIPVFLTGCYDGHEIGEFSYTSIMGIEEGESERFKFTFQFPVYSTGGNEGGGGGEEEPVSSFTIEAASFSEAIKIANTNMPKRLNFMHLKAIIASEDLAQSGKISEYIAPLLRYNEIRRTTIVIVCKGKAQEFVEASKPYSGELITQTIEDIMKKSEETGCFPKVTLNDFYDGLKAPYHALLIGYAAVNEQAQQKEDTSNSKDSEKQEQSSGEDASEEEEKKKHRNGDYYAGEVPRIGGEVIEHFGSTLFDGDKMVGKLTGLETQMLLLSRGELRTASFTIEDPKEPDNLVSLEINEFENPKINIDMTDVDKPKIHLKIELEGFILSIMSGINYENTENKKVLEEALEEFIVSGIERTYVKCKEAKTDVLNFGTVAAKYFLTIPEWEEYNWLSKFPESELKVEVDFIIRRTGQLIKTEPIFSTEGKE